jgi:hypothetical protein
MNRLDLRIQRAHELDAEVVRILIDGIDLIDLVRPIELPFARAEGHPEIAGGYDGLPPRDWVELPERYDDDDRAALLGCASCGEPGCWPLRARVKASGDSVIWSDFQQPHRPEWSYASFGPFVFNRAQYDEEVARLRARAWEGDV